MTFFPPGVFREGLATCRKIAQKACEAVTSEDVARHESAENSRWQMLHASFRKVVLGARVGQGNYLAAGFALYLVDL